MTSTHPSFRNICMYSLNYGGGGLVTQSCLILATPWTVACQAPLSLGFFLPVQARIMGWVAISFSIPNYRSCQFDIFKPISIYRMTKHHHYECLGSGSVAQLYVSKANNGKPSK